MPGEGLLVVMTDISPDLEDEFNRWYDEEHVPALLGVPGFLTARRYRALQGAPKYLAMYELEDVRVLGGPEFRRVSSLNPEADPRSREMVGNFRNWIRGAFRCQQSLPDPEPTDLSSARALILRGLDIPPAMDEEFHAWYGTEHLPRLAQVPGFLRARRFKLDPEVFPPMGDPHTYLGAHDLAFPEAAGSPELRRAIDTPWSFRMRRYYASRLRNVYERISD